MERKRRTSLDRAIDTQARLVGNVADLYSSARSFHLTSAQINERFAAIMASAPKRTPRHVFEYVRGYRDALSKALYHSNGSALVYGGYIGETFYSTHRDRADYYEKHGIEPREYADDGRVQRRGHYWADDPRKPFFAESEI